MRIDCDPQAAFNLLAAPGFTDEFFDEQIKLVDIELAKLKELLEAAS